MDLDAIVLVIVMRVLVKIVDNGGATLDRETRRGLSIVSNKYNSEEQKGTYTLPEAKELLELIPMFDNIREFP
jgi:hypothetical protein